MEQTEETTIKNQKIATVVRYFGIIMAIFYLVAGLSVMLLPLFESVDAQTRLLLGMMLMIYGVFRSYRIFKKG